MKHTKLLILVLLFFTFSCGTRDTSPYKEINFKSGKYKIYFVRHNSEYNVDTSRFAKEYPNFYIDNVETLTKLGDLFFSEQTEESNVNISYQLVIISEDNQTFFGGWLDMNNKKIKYGKTYNIDFKKFVQYQSSFKKLDCSIINIKSIKRAKELIYQLENSGGFVFGFTNNPSQTMLDYQGVFKLLTDSTKIDNHQEGYLIDKQIEKLFSKYGDFKLGDMSFHKQDSFMIQIYCDSIFYNNITNKYQIIEPFTDSIDFSFTVLGLSNEKIMKNANSLGIEEIEIIK
nr:hypothetical protein [uncultured Draconibacterium sp.]